MKEPSLPFSLLFIILITFLTFANTLRNSFVWDDWVHIIKNPSIRSWQTIPLTFISNNTISADDFYNVGNYRPLRTITYCVDYLLYGLKPWGFHLTSLLFHTANVLLAFSLALLILERRETALFTALIYGLHPLQTEAVNFLSARADLLCALFFFSAFILYLKAHEGKKERLCLSLSLLCYLLALMGKEMAITLPLVLLLHYLMFAPGRMSRRRFMRLWMPFLLLSVTFLPFRAWVAGSWSQLTLWPAGFYPTFLTMLTVFARYIKLFFFPLGLNPFYYNYPFVNSLFLGATLFALLILSGALGVVFFALKNSQRPVAFGIVFFFLTLLPVSNIFPITILMAERFLYIPLFGLCLASALFMERALALQRAHKMIALAPLFLLLTILTVATVHRNADWRDDFTLWSKAVKISPYNAGAHMGLASYFLRMGMVDEAMKEYERVLTLSPRVYNVHNNLGVIYKEKGWSKKAEESFYKALEMNPSYLNPYYNLAQLYLDQGHFDKAILWYKRALLVDPKNPTAIKGLEQAMARRGSQGG